MTIKPSLIPNKNSTSTRTLILRGLSFVFLLMAMVSGFLFYREYQVKRQGEAAYVSIADTVIIPTGSIGTDATPQATVMAAGSAGQTTQANGSGSDGPAATPSPEQADYQRIQKVLTINFDRLSGINPDAIGWIFSENTKINYPIVQGRDNAYYLNHMVSNEVNRLGSIFVDYRNKPDFSDEHTFILGQNKIDSAMLNDLELYKDPAYYQDHKAIYLLTKNQYFRVDIFAGYLTTTQKIDKIYFNFDNQEARERYISEVKRLSNFKSEVVLSREDKIVSFFACDYASDDSHFVVIGKLVPLNP